ERPAAGDHSRAILEPLVGTSPLGRVMVGVLGALPQPGDDLPGTTPLEQCPVVDEWLVLRLGEQLDGGAFPDAEAHRGAKVPAYRDRHRIVIPVHMGDEEPPDVAEARSECGESLLQRRTRFWDGPSGVDERQALVVGDGIDVDRTQAVVRQRQRYPVDALTEDRK